MFLFYVREGGKVQFILKLFTNYHRERERASCQSFSRHHVNTAQTIVVT